MAATVAGVKVSLTENGGKSSFSRTLPGIIYPKLAGKVLAGTVTWTCAASTAAGTRGIGRAGRRLALPRV